jgi:uncharacterized SAM-binding protein YcdF (DUF218 family)
MYVVVSKALGPLTDPGTLLVIVLLASAIAFLTRRRRWAASLQWGAVAIIVIFGVFPGGKWLALPLETRFPPNPPLPDRVAGIVALGGTERVAASVVWDQPMLGDPTPIAALVALGRRFPEAKLVFTGGSFTNLDPDVTESEVVQGFLTELGINGDRIIYERRSHNTHDNAVFTRDLVQPKAGDRWILVTQAIAMPRAVAVFRQAGWNVIPYPAGYFTDGAGDTYLSFDLQEGLRLSEIAIHEWIGLLVYRLLGYSDELFPK